MRAGGPGGGVGDEDVDAGELGEAGEAVVDQGAELGVYRRITRQEGDSGGEARGDSGDAGSRGFGVRGEGDGGDQAKVDEVEGDFGVEAVAEGLEEVGLGHGRASFCGW